MSWLKRMKHLPGPVVWVIGGILQIWAWSFRVKRLDPRGELRGEQEPRIFVLWHNRLGFLPFLLPKRIRPTIGFLASRSRDGGYIADILRWVGMPAVRGSSSRGGLAALRELRELLDNGVSVAITPDGPRGPKYHVQDGALWLASATGRAIVPVSLNCAHPWELKSWDRTQLPKPFARVEVLVGDPLHIDSGLSEENLDSWRERVRQALLQAGHEA